MGPEERKEGDRARAGATRGLGRSHAGPHPKRDGARSPDPSGRGVQVRPPRATRVRLDVRVSESARPPSADGAPGRSDLPAEPTRTAQTLE